MRTVIIGSDFMYDKNGNLKPVEINTGVGYHKYKIENDEDVFDLSSLGSFISSKQFTKVCYVGMITPLSEKLNLLCSSLNVLYEFYEVEPTEITIPFIEDADDVLIIRSAYDATALVDDTYCADKINFLELIKTQSFGAQFVYKDSDGSIISNITNIPDNDGHPNFILKSKHPQYDRTQYPKFFKVTTQEELDTIIEQNVTNEYFLMEFYYNSSQLYENHIKVYRSLNLLFPPDLESIHIGAYTIVATDVVTTTPIFDEVSFELISEKRPYIAGDEFQLKLPKLLGTDYVVMADGTLKTADELQVGDMVKTIDIPNPFNVNSSVETVNYKISMETLESETVYSTNKILKKEKVNALSYVTKITFTDGTDWLDSINSFYLSIKNNEVRFLRLSTVMNSEFNIGIGDEIILLNTLNPTTPTFELKEVSSIEVMEEFFDGWVITVEREHLFLTRASEEDDISYVAIEHNIGCYNGTACSYDPGICGKFNPYCCQTYGECVPDCGFCNVGPQKV